MKSTAPSTSYEGLQSIDTWIPEGYVQIVGPDNKKYILPEFMVPALGQDYHSAKRKEDLKTFKAPGTVSTFS